MPAATDAVLRLATDEEVRQDLLVNPADLWHSLPLDVPPDVAVRAAMERWGPPGPSPLEGEELWRLRTAEDGSFPVYLSVQPEGVCLLFSAADCPERSAADAIAVDVARLLRDAGRSDSDHD